MTSKKLRGETARQRPGGQTRWHPALPRPSEGARAITALVVLRDQVIAPILAGVRTPRRGREPSNWSAVDQHYETLRLDMNALLADCGIAA
ncbi:MAG: hypothetical protein ACRD0K_29715 [Egibacteraceae bacterium]